MLDEFSYLIVGIAMKLMHGFRVFAPVKITFGLQRALAEKLT